MIPPFYGNAWFGFAGDSIEALVGGNGRRGWVWLRRGVAVVLGGIFWLLMAKPFGIDFNALTRLLKVPPVVVSPVVVLVSAVILLLPDFIHYAAWPFTRWVESVYLGSGEIELPPLNYAPVDRALQEKRWQQAAFEFERISQWYSNEMRPYFDGIMAARLANDGDTARELFRRGIAFFPDSENILLSRLEGPLMEVRAMPME